MCCTRKRCGCAMRQSPTHSTPRAASSSAYTSVCAGPPKDHERLHLGRDLDRVGLRRDLVVGRTAGLDRHQLDLAPVELVVRGEVVDIGLRGLALLGQAFVAAGVLEERLLQQVGLRLVQRDRDRVGGDAGHGRAPVVAACPRLDARRRVPTRHRDLPRARIAAGTPVHVDAPGLRFVEGERPSPRGGARRPVARGRRRYRHGRDRQRDRGADGDQQATAPPNQPPNQPPNHGGNGRTSARAPRFRPGGSGSRVEPAEGTEHGRIPQHLVGRPRRDDRDRGRARPGAPPPTVEAARRAR